MSKIIIARKSLLISENIFQNENHANEIISCMNDIIRKNSNGKLLKIGNDILNKNIRNKELENWLNYIKNNK